jgi:hypothetical protein
VSLVARDIPASITPRVHRVLRLAAVVGIILGVETTILHLLYDPLADVHAYYNAGARLNAGLPLYIGQPDTNANDFYRYPPLLAIAFRPLALLPFTTAALIWEAILVAATYLTIRRLGFRESVVLVTCWLALPIMWTLVIGQAQALVTLGLAYGTPLGVAFAANLKVFPGLVALYWIGRRDWHRLGMFAGWMAAIIGLQLILEPTATLAYLGFLSLDQVGYVENRSLYAYSPPLWVAAIVIMTVLTLRLAKTRWGWPAAVVLSVFATPRLLIYQVSTLLAVMRKPDDEPGATGR